MATIKRNMTISSFRKIIKNLKNIDNNDSISEDKMKMN